MCTAEQSLKRGLSDSSVQKSSPDDENRTEVDDDELKQEDQKEKVSGRKTRKKSGGQEMVENIPGKPLPNIKVEDTDKSPKSEVKVEEDPEKERVDLTNQVSEKRKVRSRSRRRSGLWETIPKSLDVKAEPEIMATENPQNCQPRSRSGQGKPMCAPEKDSISIAKIASPAVEQGRGKRKSSGRLITSPTKGQKRNPEEENVVTNTKPSNSEKKGETKVRRETSGRRTSKRRSTAPFSTEKLKPETKKGGNGGENDSDSDFEPSANVTPTSTKRGKGKAENASTITTKRTPTSVKGSSKKQKRAELESEADDEDFEPPAKKTPKSGKKVWCEQNQWFANSVAPKSGKLGKKSKKVWCDQENHWAEVYLEVEGR